MNGRYWLDVLIGLGGLASFLMGVVLLTGDVSNASALEYILLRWVAGSILALAGICTILFMGASE